MIPRIINLPNTKNISFNKNRIITIIAKPPLNPNLNTVNQLNTAFVLPNNNNAHQQNTNTQNLHKRALQVAIIY